LGKIIYSNSEFISLLKESNIKIDTNFFTFDKLKCKYGNYLLISPQTLNFLIFLDALKNRFPYQITSFYRSPKNPYYGKGTSKHSFSLAIDLDPTLEKIIKLNEDIETKKFMIDSFQGIGFYNNHIHLDWREANLYWSAVPDSHSSDGWDYEYFEKFDMAFSHFLGNLKHG